MDMGAKNAFDRLFFEGAIVGLLCVLPLVFLLAITTFLLVRRKKAEGAFSAMARQSPRLGDVCRYPIKQTAHTARGHTMFAQDFGIRDLERLGPIVERLLQSGKLTDDEKWAVDQSCRAATDLAHIRQSEIAKAFYARPDIEERCESSIDEWLVNNRDAEPGTVTAICCRIHVASYDRNGNLGLYPILEL